MTDLVLVKADRMRIVESILQITLPANEAITAGNGIRIDTATGKWTNANATVAAEARVRGVATKTVATGEPLTGIVKGVLAGHDLSALTYDDDVFLSNTDGALADLAGTVSTIAGTVIPGTAEVLNASFAKLLLVDL